MVDAAEAVDLRDPAREGERDARDSLKVGDRKSGARA